MPAAAQRTLLFQLAAAGARLRYHGDFDWPGIAIANTVMTMFGASAWGFGVQDYDAALQAMSMPTRPLSGNAVTARWDSALSAAMQIRGRAIDEEAVAASLLVDLDSRNDVLNK
jgi:uncharacterized protein (TIGR02679 family)